MNLLSIDSNALLFLYQESFAEAGEEPGTVDAARLDAALAYPLNRAVSSEDDVAAIAAAYAIGMSQYRPFTIGNARAALLALELFLSLNGWQLEIAQDDALRVMQEVNSVGMDETALANWVRRHL